MITPSKKVFLESIKNGGIPPLHEELPFLYPCAIYESFASSNSILFESIKGPDKISRYSFVAFDPCLVFKSAGGVIQIESSEKKTLFSKNPIRLLRDLLGSYRQIPVDYLPPFQGGLAGVLGYDFVHYLEKLPKNAVDDVDLPDAHFLMFDKVFAFDHPGGKCWIIVCPGVGDATTGKTQNKVLDWSKKYDEAVEAIRHAKSVIDDMKPGTEELHTASRESSVKRWPLSINYEMKQTEYMDIVTRAKNYIAAGDIFQINLSQRVSACIGDKDPWRLYKILRSINPSPFSAFADFGDYQIVSSSPERLLRVMGRTIETRPIAGTRPRGRDSSEDEMMREELLLNFKERAEHIMLIDLERNDLGRISEYGTVSVDELMITEDYSHVIHIVSNVTGTLLPGKDCFDAIKAAFPGGTITGVPKVRCMEIIDELEPVRRGPYTGSVGYIGFTGNMDLNIIIRTFVIKNGIAYVQAGAGIVADSDPEREYFETLKKAEALIRTLEKI